MKRTFSLIEISYASLDFLHFHIYLRDLNQNRGHESLFELGLMPELVY